jgi:hypothetical protein
MDVEVFSALANPVRPDPDELANRSACRERPGAGSTSAGRPYPSTCRSFAKLDSCARSLADASATTTSIRVTSAMPKLGSTRSRSGGLEGADRSRASCALEGSGRHPVGRRPSLRARHGTMGQAGLRGPGSRARSGSLMKDSISTRPLSRQAFEGMKPGWPDVLARIEPVLRDLAHS